MLEHLSKRMDQVIQLAGDIAREYEQDYVGTGHVLLAIVREGTGVGAGVLKAHGLSEARIKNEVDALSQAVKEQSWVFGRLHGSPHFKNVMAKAIEAARELKSRNVCTEHLLLGLLEEGGSVAHTALTNLGITAEVIRAGIETVASSSSSRST